MDHDRLEKEWPGLRQQLVGEWNALTGDDLAAIGGSKDRLVEMLQRRHGLDRERAERGVEEWWARVTYWCQGKIRSGRGTL